MALRKFFVALLTQLRDGTKRLLKMRDLGNMKSVDINVSVVDEML